MVVEISIASFKLFVSSTGTFGETGVVFEMISDCFAGDVINWLSTFWLVLGWLLVEFDFGNIILGGDLEVCLVKGNLGDMVSVESSRSYPPIFLAEPVSEEHLTKLDLLLLFLKDDVDPNLGIGLGVRRISQNSRGALRVISFQRPLLFMEDIFVLIEVVTSRMGTDPPSVNLEPLIEQDLKRKF